LFQVRFRAIRSSQYTGLPVNTGVFAILCPGKLARTKVNANFAARLFHKNTFEMNKGDLISKIAADASISKAQAGDALNAVLDGIAGALQSGDKVTLIGFGTFSVSKRDARTGRNPKTNAKIEIPAKTVVKFKPGKELADSVG
jgi:nucleoid DNA-binding protein